MANQHLEKLLGMIDDIKNDIPEGKYIEMMNQLKKEKDYIDEEKKELLEKNIENNKEVLKLTKDLEFEKEKMKKMDKDKRIQILKTQIKTLKNKCDAYHIGLHECFEDIDTENIDSIYLNEFDRCPLTGRALYEFTIQNRNGSLEGSMECNQVNNYVRCYCCNVKVWENTGRDEHWDFKDDEGKLQYKQSRTYCKNCLELM